MENKLPIADNRISILDRLNQPVSFRKKSMKYPTKSTMGFSTKASDERNLAKRLAFAAILAVLATVLVKFGVVDRLQAVYAAREEVASYQQQRNELDAQLVDFYEIQKNYRRYPGNYLNEEEAALIDRITLLNTIQNAAKGLVQISSVTIAGHDASVMATARELALISQYTLVLQSSAFVQGADVSSANTVDDAVTGEQYVTAAILLTLGQEVAQ